MQTVYYIPHVPDGELSRLHIPAGVNLVEGAYDRVGNRVFQYHTGPLNGEYRFPAGAREFVLLVDAADATALVNGTALPGGSIYEQTSEHGTLPEFTVVGTTNSVIIQYPL